MKENIKKIAIWIGAVAVGRLMGINVFIPAVSGFLAYYFIKKSDHQNSIKLKYPLSYLIAHTSWMTLAYVYLILEAPSKLPEFFLLDVAVSITFVLLLIMVVKKWVYISIYLYEIISLLLNIEALASANTFEARALFTHMVLRVAIVVTLFLALRNKSFSEDSNVGVE